MIKIVIIDIRNVIFAFHGPVVQLDRISDFGSEGWGFESSLGHNCFFLFINAGVEKSKNPITKRIIGI